MWNDAGLTFLKTDNNGKKIYCYVVLYLQIFYGPINTFTAKHDKLSAVAF